MTVPNVGSEKHDKLMQFVRSRRNFARRYFSARHDRWRESEKSFRGYVEPKKSKDPNVPWLRKLFVPVTPLLVQTQLSFDLASFTQRSPIIGLAGTGPEDVMRAKPAEAYLEWEWHARNMLGQVWGWLVDRRRYGLGVLWNRWTQDIGFRTRRQESVVEMPALGISLRGPDIKLREEFIRYEGNDPQCQDVFSFGFDPRVTASRVYDGEFVYRTVRRSYAYLLEQEKAGFYTNVQAINKHQTQHNQLQGFHGQGIGGMDMGDRDGSSDRNRIVGMEHNESIGREQVDPMEKGDVELTEMVARVIPRDYEIGDGSDPELYWITMANDAVIIRSEPFDFDHQQFPVALIESNPDPHSILNISSVEEMAELQKYANWLYRSRAEHVIRTINGQYLVDPSKIHIEDLLTPQPGNLIRIKPDAFNVPGGLRDAFQQMQTMDVTKGHVGEIQNILGFLERLSAATENLQGTAAGGETTLGEQQMANQGAIGRLRIGAQLAWNQGMIPLAKQRLANAGQLLDDERYVRLVGGVADALGVSADKQFMSVTPDDVNGSFDIMPIDGIVRGDGQLLQAWTQIFQSVTNSPQLAMRYDITGIFRFIAMLSGVKNLGDFEMKQLPPQANPMGPGAPGAEGSQIQVTPDEDIARAVEAGNLVPVGSEL